MAKKSPPLHVELVENNQNYLYLSLIEYKRTTYLCVIDNVKKDEITAYVIDNITDNSLSLQDFLSVCNIWYYRSSEKYPISMEFNRLGLNDRVYSLVKTFNSDYVTRIVGKVFTFNLDAKPKVKRKRANLVPKGVEIRVKTPK